MRDPYEQLIRVKEAISKISIYVAKGRRKFDREETVRLSIIYYLQMISDAANTLTEDFKRHYPDIPWKDFSNFQIFLTHYYSEIDEDVLWYIASYELPALEARIEALLETNDRITEHSKSISSDENASSEVTDVIKKLLQAKREEILETARKYGAYNIRLFGSTVKGVADTSSDIDLLVDMEPGRTLFDLSELLMDLQDILGREVDVVTEKGLNNRIRERVLKEAIPL